MLSKFYHPEIHGRPPVSGWQRVVGITAHARRQWVWHYSKLAGSEIMQKARAHRPAASRAAGGGVGRCLVCNGSDKTAGWLYGQKSGALLLGSWAKYLAGFVGRSVCTWGADCLAVFFCTLSLRLTRRPW